MLGIIFKAIAMRERIFRDCTTHQFIFNCANVPYWSFFVFIIDQLGGEKVQKEKPPLTPQGDIMMTPRRDQKNIYTF